MTRHFWVLIHRYAGLTMAFFLIVAGLTGSILAFRGEIEHWLNPEDYKEYPVPIQAKPLLDPFELRERALALEPSVQCNSVPPHTEPGKVFTLACEIVTHKGKTETPESRNISLNPYTGERIPNNLPIPSSEPSLWPVTRKNIMTCIFFCITRCFLVS
jgi:uncharacterized iron-regulated membrane protein